MSKKDLRFIPLTEGFMDKKTNDILYGYLQTITYLDKNRERYVIQNDLDNQLHIIKDLMDLKTNKTVKAHLKHLIEVGLVVKGTTKDLKGNDIDCLYLPTKEHNIFKLIPLETLEYLIFTKNKFSIKIYVYLLNKYQWKNGENKTYEFSKKELLRAVGWKGTHQREYDIINNILLDLSNSGLISYFEGYKMTNGVKHPYLGLTYVGAEVRGLKELEKGTVEEEPKGFIF